MKPYLLRQTTILRLVILIVFSLVTIYHLNAFASGAQIDRVSSGSLVSISARHAPNSEIVVVDGSGEVLAGALDSGNGVFSLTFRVSPSAASQMQIFGVDLANQTRAVSLPVSGVSNLLLPPSLVVDPAVTPTSSRLVLAGYSHPGSSVTVTLRGQSESRTVVVVAEADGGFQAEFLNLVTGRYTATAVSQLALQSSSPSLEIEVIVSIPTPVIVPQVVDRAAQAVSQVVEDVVSRVLPDPVRQTVRNVAPQASQVAQTVTPVVSAGLLTQLAWLLKDLPFLIAQALISMLQYFGFWKKRNPWGLVYDAYTKQPLMLATVRLYQVAQARKLVESDVSSRQGVFSFEIGPGEYQIEVAKPGYIFPSRLVTGSTDGEHHNVYHGSVIRIREKNSLIQVTIPMDPEKITGVGWGFKLKSIIRSRLPMFTNVMLVVGLLMSLVSVVGGERGLSSLLLIFYCLVLGIKAYRYYAVKHSWGVVVDRKGQSVAGVRLNLIDPKFNKLVQRRITSDEGKYQFVVPHGSYILQVENPEYKLASGIKGTYQGQEIVVAGDKPTLLAMRLVIEPVERVG